MEINYFYIQFERDVFYPGQVISGRVFLSINEPKELEGKDKTVSRKQ